MTKYRCSVCNWTFDEDKEGKPFSSLPESFHCPVCSSQKSAFFPEGVVKADKKISTNVAEKIIEQLEIYGVKHIYGIPGAYLALLVILAVYFSFLVIKGQRWMNPIEEQDTD